MHKTYTDAMNRKAHRYALLKVAKESSESINWKATEQDWNMLKAADTGDTILVSVRIEISKDRYEKIKKQYERKQNETGR